MLEPILHKLQTKSIILASASPRRRNILNLIKLPFEVKVSNFEENLQAGDFKHPYEYAIETAKQKALMVSKDIISKGQSADLVIGADTIVYYNNKIYEKPKDENDAISILTTLSGTTHYVFTGVALVQTVKEGEAFSLTTFYEKTGIKLGPLTREVIEAYVATGEPMDKAGGYGIQGIGGSLVEGIQGDYYNVQGFPLYNFCCHLSKMYNN